MTMTLEQRLRTIEQAIEDVASGMLGISVGPGTLNGQMIAPKSINAGSLSVQNLQSVNARTGNLSVTGAITVSTGGSIGSGQTAYNTGVGYWIEANSGTPRMSIGNSAGNRLTWDGTTLAIVGNITATTGTIGGWTIGSTTLTGGHVTLDSANGIKLTSAGSWGDTIQWWTGGGSTKAGSIIGIGSALMIVQGDGSAPSSYLNLGTGSTMLQGYDLGTGPAALSLDTGWHLGVNGSTYLQGASNKVNAYFPLYPGAGGVGQSTRYISDDGTRIKIVGELDVSANTINFATASPANGALPSPNKAISVKASGTTYYFPVWNGYSPWTA